MQLKINSQIGSMDEDIDIEKREKTSSLDLIPNS